MRNTWNPPQAPAVKPGDKFGRWTVVELIRDGGRWHLLCKCECGTQRRVRWDGVSSGANRSCGCIQRIDKPLAGQRFGRWLTGEAIRHPGKWMVQCTCDCGETKLVRFDHLKAGKTVSCGCYAREQMAVVNLKHGDSRKRNGQKAAPEFATWLSMRQRCYDPKNKAYRFYGARGITICDEWLKSYSSFLAHVGRKPSPEHSIERIDNNGNYEPGNVRWATRVEQCNNRRSSHFLDWNGKCQTMAQWGREVGIDPLTLSARLSRGWSAEKTLTTPLR